MNEREEQISQRLQEYKEGLSLERILPVRLSVKDTLHLLEDVEYLLEVVSNLRKEISASAL
jgi:hypothetical protein